MLRRVPQELARRMATLVTPKVEHNSAEKVFFISLKPETSQATSRAVLEYEVLSSGALDLYHTEVPPPLRGQGIAALLVKAAFDHCVSNNLKMKLTCTYVQKYYNENKLPEYTSQVVD